MLLECVPNVSEGRNAAILDRCAAAIAQSGARILHRTSDPIHNRSVFTIAGEYAQLRESALALAATTVEEIDLRTHTGVHPRIGALDVLPFIPLQGAGMADAVRLAREVASEIWERLHVPAFLYGEAAATPLRRNLAAVRQGQFEGLDARFELPDWRPDFGDIAKHSSAGAIAVGARGILIAFNVELATGDLAVAKRIARVLRERDGGFRTLKALGLRLTGELVQVSLNITDYRATPLYRVVEVIRGLAAAEGVAMVRSELIGCLPFDAVRESAEYYLGVSRNGTGST
ncbi:MAG TPA: glutamate formimidoyltransferase [Candidatus Baltobacteraceae bacterium]|jgi:glutamate formiminotransferase|nr:glutamate formimidoyltransferase [Candidatus Baltobacteraceae bacterium]